VPCHSICLIGHVRPFCALATRLVRERETIIITFIIPPNVLVKARTEVSRQFLDEPSEGWIILCSCALAFGKLSCHARNTFPAGNSISSEVVVGVCPKNLAALARTSLISDVKIKLRSCMTLICKNMTREKTRWSFFQTLRISFSRTSFQMLSSYNSADMSVKLRLNVSVFETFEFSGSHCDLNVTIYFRPLSIRIAVIFRPNRLFL
jgi:hypothetical protein